MSAPTAQVASSKQGNAQDIHTKRRMDACAKIHKQSSRLANNEQFKALGTTQQILLMQISIASTLAHKCLDMTLDAQGGMFFEQTQTQLVKEILAQYNEQVIVDIDAIAKLVYPMWMMRHGVAVGRFNPGEFIDGANEFLTQPQVEVYEKYLAICCGKK